MMKSFMVGALLLRTINAQAAPVVDGVAPIAVPDVAPPTLPIPVEPPVLPPVLETPPAVDPTVDIPVANPDPLDPTPLQPVFQPVFNAPPPVIEAPVPIVPVLAPVPAPVGGTPDVPVAAPPPTGFDPVLGPFPAVPLPLEPVNPTPPGVFPIPPVAVPIVPPVAPPVVDQPIPPVTPPVVDQPIPPVTPPVVGQPVPPVTPPVVQPPVVAPLPGTPVPPIVISPGETGPDGLPLGPYDPSSIYDPTSPFYDPYAAAPPGWQGDDNNAYEGEGDDDYYPGGKPSYDDEECPAWCQDVSYSSYPESTAYSPYKPVPTPKYPEYTSTTDLYVTYTPEPYSKYESSADPYPKYEPTPDPYQPAPEYPTPSYEDIYPTPTPEYAEDPVYYPGTEEDYPRVKKIRAARRQAWAQPAYNEDDDIPDWLYELEGAPAKPVPAPKPQPKCPKSCYKNKPARPTYTKTRRPAEGGYQTTEKPYYPSPTSDDYADYTSSSVYYYPYPQGNSSTPVWPTSIPDESTSVPDESTSVPDESTSVPDESTSVPDESTSVPSESTAAPYNPYVPTTPVYEPTTLVTQYQPQPYPAETGAGWGKPAGDYTGETLATVCPNVCNPFNPAENFCDQTTGCATTGGSKYYCACRAGYRADGYNAKDFSKQFKVPGQPYVYLAVRVSCNTLCSDSTCSEVLERSQCK